MRPQDLVHLFALGGAALTLYFDDHSPTLIIASEIVLTDRYLLYYTIGSDYTGGVHRLDHDAMSAPHPLGVEFFRHGRQVAYMCPVFEDGDESVARWKQWQEWIAGHAEFHAAAIAAEFLGFAEEG